MPEPVSVFLPSRTGANLKLGSSSSRRGCSKHFCCPYFAGGFTHLCPSCFPALAAQAPMPDTSAGWGFLKQDPRRKSLSPACGLSLQSPIAALFPAAASGGTLANGHQPQAGIMPQLYTEWPEKWKKLFWGFWGPSLKYRKEKTQLKGKCNPPLCLTKIISHIFLASLTRGALTEKPLLTHSTSTILSWALPGLPPNTSLPALILTGHGTNGSANGHPQVLTPHPSAPLTSPPVAPTDKRLMQAETARWTSRAPVCFLAFGRDQRHPWTQA